MKLIDQYQDIELIDALEERYLAYALTTIMDSALPDSRDWLKPSHRRFLNGMFKCLINPLVKGCTTKPVVKLLSILPVVFNSLAILFAVLIGIAKPIPIEPRL